MTGRLTRRLAGERGSVLITGLLLSLALLMIIGVAVDVGHAFIVRRDLVSIADDAALQGSQQINLSPRRQPPTQPRPGASRRAAGNSARPGLTAQASASGASAF